MKKPSVSHSMPVCPYRLSAALAFVLASAALVWLFYSQLGVSLVFAAIFGGYMALNIGANDVANNVGPAVGARAVKLGVAVAIAAVCEAAGALIAGRAVVGTVGSGIVDPAVLGDPAVFIWIMMAALLAAAVWLNIATAIGAPVSTTHSIVGGVLGAGIAAGGWSVANWGTVGNIAASWVISPALGGLIAAAFLFFMKQTITYQEDMVKASQRIVPLLIGLMGWAFLAFLLIKIPLLAGIFNIFIIVSLSLIAGVLCYFASRAYLRHPKKKIHNSKKGINTLFAIPLVFAAALLSFAHGSNDVANAIGPLAAIFNVLQNHSFQASAAVPVWTMLLGALGLSLGLLLYGPKLIKTVGTEITDMDNMRAYSIAMAATITVILASQLGMPISTTHVTIGAIFGVGFLREQLKTNYKRAIAKIEKHHEEEESHPEEVEEFFVNFEKASAKLKGKMLKDLKKIKKKRNALLEKKERKKIKRIYREQLVRRAIIFRVVAAWIITVPGTAVLAALFFFTIRGMLLP